MKEFSLTQAFAETCNSTKPAGDLKKSDWIFCLPEEAEKCSTRFPSASLIPVFATPFSVYTMRDVIRKHATAVATFSEETAKRLRMFHHSVLCGGTVAEMAEQLDFTAQGEVKASELNDGALTVLFVTHNFMVGGLEQVVIDLASYLKKLGHRPIIAYEDRVHEITRRDIEKAGIEHARLPESPEARKDFLERLGISLVNAHYATIMADEARACGIPYLQTIHNMYLWLGEKDIAQWRELDKKTAAYIAVSANATMIADLRLGLSVEKMSIIPNGAPCALAADADMLPEHDEGLRRELGIPENAIVFIQVASINGVKGQTVAVEALARALKVNPDLYLVFLGNVSDAGYMECLKRKIAWLGIEKNARFAGYRKDVKRFLNLARAMVAPSLIEGWSLAITEAVKACCPVIATDVGGAREQLAGGGHIILPALYEDILNPDPAAFYQAVYDEELCAKGGQIVAEAMLYAAQNPLRPCLGKEALMSCDQSFDAHLKIMLRLRNEASGSAQRETGVSEMACGCGRKS